MSQSQPHQDFAGLAPILHRRWAAPILAQLAKPSTAISGRARVSALAVTLGVTRQTVRRATDELTVLGLIAANPGHGHPLRPELVLTVRGKNLGPGFIELDARLAELDLRDVGYRKWSLPALGAVGEGPSRFSDVSGSLGPATDRAVSLALGDLFGAGLIRREVINAAPPRPIYSVSKHGGPIARTVRALAASL